MPQREEEQAPEVGIDLKERAMDEAPVGITISDPDLENNPLIYANDAFQRVTGYPPEEVIGKNCRMLQGEETDPETVAEMREAIDNEEPVTVEVLNYRRGGEPFWNEVTIAPLTDDEGEVTHFVGFQNDVTARKEAEQAVERERRNLDHLLGRLRGLVSDVTAEVIAGESREAVEQGVLDRFVETERYGFAWIGESDGSTLQPRAWSGDADVVPDELRVNLADSDDPSVRAIESQSVEIEDLSAAATDPLPSLPTDCSAIPAIPLTAGDRRYGVLTIHAVQPDAFDEREIAVLEAIGRIIGTALDALASRRILTTDSLVEVELEVHDPDLFFVDLSERCDCQLEFEGSVSDEAGGLSMFFRTDGDPGEIVDEAAYVSGVEGAELVSSGPEWSLVEFHVDADSFVVDLAERGVRTQSIVANAGTARIEIEFPAEVDARGIVEGFQGRYPGTELVSYHERERPPTTSVEFLDHLEESLTDRQRTALQKAYLGGYYDASRETTGDELADSMGITRATFHQHLRAAERKLIGEFFDR